MTKTYKYLLPITAVFTATLLIANTLDVKIFMLFGLELPAGIVIFPLAYLADDMLTEVYGFAVSRRVIWSGLAALAIMVGAYELARALPSASFWRDQAAFDTTLAQVPRIVLASVIAYFFGEFSNSFVVAKMKVWTTGRFMALRFVASTIVGQFVDTTLFVLIAFVGTFAPAELVQVVFSAWLVKVGWEFIALPVTVPFVRWLKRAENEDFFDKDTNFNPFLVR
jgi:uncharacterized integral membrane protein (TIGR00697 family)